jgi:hypothetical protein
MGTERWRMGGASPGKHQPLEASSTSGPGPVLGSGALAGLGVQELCFPEIEPPGLPEMELARE